MAIHTRPSDPAGEFWMTCDTGVTYAVVSVGDGVWKSLRVAFLLFDETNKENCNDGQVRDQQGQGR
jgi:hypothetical protein